MSQNTDIKKEIIQCLDGGFSNKEDIFTEVEKRLKVPRPTIRRVARDLRIEMVQKVNILQKSRKDDEIEKGDLNDQG